MKNMEKKIRAARSALPSGAKAGEIYEHDMVHDWLAYHNESTSIFWAQPTMGFVRHALIGLAAAPRAGQAKPPASSAVLTETAQLDGAHG